MNTQAIARFARENPTVVQLGQEQVTAVLARAATDRAFRQHLMTDPHSAIKDATGHVVPKDFRVAFIENTADATVVLPAVVSAAELSEQELEAVAGGTEVIAIGLACFAASILIGVSIAKLTKEE